MKTVRSSNDFSKLIEKQNKYGKSSFFNSTSWMTESNPQSNLPTNKNSVHENILQQLGSVHFQHLVSQSQDRNNKSINIDPQLKMPLPTTHHRAQSHLSKASGTRSSSKDSELNGGANDTFVVNESKENTEYVRKMCAVLEDKHSNYTNLPSYYTPLIKPEHHINQGSQSPGVDSKSKLKPPAQQFIRNKAAKTTTKKGRSLPQLTRSATQH